MGCLLIGFMPGLPGATAAAARPLTLAVADLPYAAPVLIAEAEGFFTAEGLALKFVHCAVGRLCLQKLLDGQADLATAADTPIAVAAFGKKPFAIIATTTTAGSELRMVARADRAIRVPADLKGKRIGTVKGTTSHYFTETFLTFHGIKASEVTLVDLQPNTASAALVRGEVDAAGLFEPQGRMAVKQLGSLGRVLSTPRFFTLTFNLVSVGAEGGVSDDDIGKVLRAVQRAESLMSREPERARAIVAKALKLDPAAVAEGWADLDFKLQLGQPLINTLESQARWALREGLAPAGQPIPDFLDYVRPGPLQRLDAGAVRLVK